VFFQDWPSKVSAPTSPKCPCIHFSTRTSFFHNVATHTSESQVYGLLPVKLGPMVFTLLFYCQ